MKNIKKISLITLLSAGMIITTACSQTANQTAENKTEQKQEEKKVEVTKDNAFKLVREALDKQKSYKADITLNFKPAEGALVRPTTLEMLLSLKNNPLEYSVTDKNEIPHEYLSYGKDGNHYIPNGPGKWLKMSFNPKGMGWSSNVLFSYLNQITNFGKGEFTLTEEGEFYTLDFNPNMDEFKEFAKEPLEKYTASIKFKKTDLLPVSAKFETTRSTSDHPLKGTETIEVNFKDYGADFTIELPDEVKNS